MKNIGIVGATGYSGVELIRILFNHPQVDIHSLYSSSADGSAFATHFPHVTGLNLPDLQKIDPEEMARNNDLIFLATPAGVSASLTPELEKKGVKVVDLSGDLRLESPELYKQWYKKEPAGTAILKSAVYGLPEWNKEAVQKANVIANPGCYPTATLLSLLPIMKADWIDPKSVIVDAKSGVSGAGRGVSLGVHYSELNESIHAYKVGEHQHTPEIEQELRLQTGKAAPIQFTPHLVPMTRGILTTAYANLTGSKSLQDIQELYESTYANEPFVRVRPLGSLLKTKDVYGTNFCDIAIHLDERTNRVVLLAVIDNVVKGAAGQAVQNMNLMFGFEEKMALPQVALYP
ncbi:N-acetyl-gamma-glutamyl-phosphate reductase [Brevibacillus daliensis]|uniref:N-acetyl-gamma-glutamyl-phosphate reductase n=1 Tax=Brevibacillus daliensis TaxID=2892995 RepID=UPI001E517905|nr:N-acetyl-gamma-glutamyl-phosphate reductase [Brevibacillus daliensis]